MDILAKMNQLEQQLLVHSIMYYRLGESIWSDARYDNKAKEFDTLRKAHPDLFTKTILAEEFKDFDYTTGMNLPLWHPHYTKVAQWLYLDNKNNNGGKIYE